VTDFGGNSVAKIIQNLIIDLGLMTLPSDNGDWPLFVAHLPDDVVNSGCVYETAGVQDGRISQSGEVVEHYGIQLTVRANSYEIGRAKAEAIALALDALFNQSVSLEDSGEVYVVQNVKRTSSVISLGIEPGSQRNQLFTLNFLITIN